MSVVTRIPPSPTGRLHIGTARTALFNFLYARHHGGTVLFRSEDTDRKRSKKEYENEIIEGLNWLGLSWDSFSRQSERATRYREVLEASIAADHAYLSKEPAKDDPTRTVEVVRLRNPGREIVFKDVVHGDINMHTGDLGDFVIARSIDDAIYHFTVVVDDMDGEVTHIIRGEDHISNTARQILIQEVIGASRPTYAHIPLILDEKRAKLSKRSDTAVSVADYRAEGVLPEALVNYLALLGWSPGDDREHFSIDALIEEFSLESIQKSGASWNREKLRSVNQRWMRLLSDEAFIARGGFETTDALRLAKAIPLLKERARTFAEAKEMLAGELACLFSSPTPSREGLLKKQSVEKPEATKRHLEAAIDILASMETMETSEAAKNTLMPYAEKEGKGEVLWPLRYALSGQERSPDPFTIISIIGKEESLGRIRTALAILEG